MAKEKQEWKLYRLKADKQTVVQVKPYEAGDEDGVGKKGEPYITVPGGFLYVGPGKFILRSGDKRLVRDAGSLAKSYVQCAADDKTADKDLAATDERVSKEAERKEQRKAVRTGQEGISRAQIELAVAERAAKSAKGDDGKAAAAARVEAARDAVKKAMAQ